MKISGKGRISSNPYTSSQRIAKTETDKTAMQVSDIKKDMSRQKTQGQNLKVVFSKNAGLRVEAPQSATQQTGGATYPPAPDQFQSIPLVADTAKRLSNNSFLGYTYSLDGSVVGVVGGTPVSFNAEIYLTVGYANQRWAYNFAQSGFTVDNYDKWVVWNSFLVGYFVYDSSTQTLSIQRGLTDDRIVQGNISWINTLNDRSIVGTLGFGSGINVYDFQTQDPTKITEEQYQQFVNGELTNIKVAFGVRVDNLSVAQQTHFNNNVAPATVLSPALEFYGASIISNFN